MRFKKSKDRTIYPNQLCTVTKMNDIIELRALMYTPTGLQSITKINQDLYMINKTGEIKEYKHTDNRGQNIGSMKKSFTKLRNLINNNFSGKRNELFVTLTYAENMQDINRLYKDFKNFMGKLRYRYSDVDYIMVPEPQQRGAWHCHVLLRFNGRESIYIPNQEIADIWKHGFTTTKALKGVDNIGAYLSAYLADIELTEETASYLKPGSEVKEIETRDEQGRTQTKRYIKGERCRLYPRGKNLVRPSRGCHYPESEKMLYTDAKKIVGDCSPDYGCTVTISDDNGKTVNTVTYQHFNLKRKKKQEGENGNDD